MSFRALIDHTDQTMPLSATSLNNAPSSMERDSALGASPRWRVFVTSALCAVFITSIAGAGYGRYLEKQAAATAAVQEAEADARMERAGATSLPARRPRLTPRPHLYEEVDTGAVVVSA